MNMGTEKIIFYMFSLPSYLLRDMLLDLKVSVIYFQTTGDPYMTKQKT